MIERYLAELRRQLPFSCRRRVLEEVEEHLRLSARAVGEEQAVARFGPVDEVARSFRVRARRFYAALVLAAAVAYPVLTYPILENGLPPAPWPSEDEIPAGLAWKRDAIVWLIGAAAVAAAIALGGHVWRRRLFMPGALVSLSTLVAVGVLATILNAEWSDQVPGVPRALLALGPLQITVALAGLTLLWWSRDSEALPQHPEDTANDLTL